MAGTHSGPSGRGGLGDVGMGRGREAEARGREAEGEAPRGQDRGREAEARGREAEGEAPRGQDNEAPGHHTDAARAEREAEDREIGQVSAIR
jgi:hypothetical protein